MLNVLQFNKMCSCVPLAEISLLKNHYFDPVKYFNPAFLFWNQWKYGIKYTCEITMENVIWIHFWTYGPFCAILCVKNPSNTFSQFMSFCQNLCIVLKNLLSLHCPTAIVSPTTYTVNFLQLHVLRIYFSIQIFEITFCYESIETASTPHPSAYAARKTKKPFLLLGNQLLICFNIPKFLSQIYWLNFSPKNWGIQYSLLRPDLGNLFSWNWL